MQKFIDPDHPFYRPLWKRLLIVGSCALWTTVEFLNGATTWGMIFLAVTAYTSATLLVFFKPKAEVVANPATATVTDDEDAQNVDPARPPVTPAPGDEPIR